MHRSNYRTFPDSGATDDSTDGGCYDCRCNTNCNDGKYGSLYPYGGYHNYGSCTCFECAFCNAGDGCSDPCPDVASGCPAGQYLDGCGDGHWGKCVACPACPRGYLISSCGGTSNGTCILHDCPPGMHRSNYLTFPDSAATDDSTDGGCYDCRCNTNCNDGKYGSLYPYGGYHNYGSCTCFECAFCNAGDGCSDPCPDVASGCPAGQYLDGCGDGHWGTCAPCQVCPEGYVKANCSGTSNRRASRGRWRTFLRARRPGPGTGCARFRI